MCNNWEHISYFWISCLVFHVLSDGDYQHIMGGPPVPWDSFNKIIFSKSKLNFGSEIPPDTLFCPRLVDGLLFHHPWSCPIFKLQWTSATVYLYTTTQYLNLRYSDTKPKLQFFFDQSSSQLVHVWNLDRKSGSPAESKPKPGHLTGRVIIVQPPNTPSKNVPHKLAYPIALYPMLPTIATCYRTMLLPIIYFLHEIFTSWSVFFYVQVLQYTYYRKLFFLHIRNWSVWSIVYPKISGTTFCNLFVIHLYSS